MEKIQLYISAVLYQYDPIFLFCFRCFFCEIGTLLTNSWSETKVSNFFSPIASKSSITVLNSLWYNEFFVVKFSEVILHKWIHCNAFNQSSNFGRKSFVKM